MENRIVEAMNRQINAELWSAYMYLSMSLDAESKGMKGVANWMFVQWLEEQDHARILQLFMLSVDAKVELMPIDGVPTSWESVLEMFRGTLLHEIEVSSMIHQLMRMAVSVSDYATVSRLQWFVDEQVEEENSARDIVNMLEMVEGDSTGLFKIDCMLYKRKYEKAAPLL